MCWECCLAFLKIQDLDLEFSVCMHRMWYDNENDIFTFDFFQLNCVFCVLSTRISSDNCLLQSSTNVDILRHMNSLIQTSLNVKCSFFYFNRNSETFKCYHWRRELIHYYWLTVRYWDISSLLFNYSNRLYPSRKILQF